MKDFAKNLIPELCSYKEFKELSLPDMIYLESLRTSE